MLSVSIDRTLLSLSPLAISDFPSGGLWLPEDGFGRPAKTRRNVYAASSPFVNGQTLVQSVLESSSLPFSTYAQGATGAALDALMDEVDEALGQFSYTITVTEDGVPKTWTCDPADVSWGELDSGMARVHMARATVTVPVYPVAS